LWYKDTTILPYHCDTEESFVIILESDFTEPLFYHFFVLFDFRCKITKKMIEKRIILSIFASVLIEI